MERFEDEIDQQAEDDEREAALEAMTPQEQRQWIGQQLHGVGLVLEAVGRMRECYAQPELNGIAGIEALRNEAAELESALLAHLKIGQRLSWDG